MSKWLPIVLGTGLALAFGAMPGCTCANGTAARVQDLAGVGRDLAGSPPTGDGPIVDNDALNACGDFDPSCTVVSTGPTGNPPTPFPLPSDSPPPDNVNADGVGRDPTGALVLDNSHANFNYLWIADDTEYHIGLISKISTSPRTAPSPNPVNNRYAEVARYLTVTCYSDSNKATWPTTAQRQNNIRLTVDQLGPCDGTNGCCSNAPGGMRTPVQIITNHPSRTAVDYNGDVWVANRAHIDTPNPHQSSVTKIANNNSSDPTKSDCIDRNGNGKIDTSYDANGDGIIDTDCNENNIPDDLMDVTTTIPSPNPNNVGPCKNGKQQEFFGLDDECVLFTTNTGSVNGWGRPLALGPGNVDFGPSDAWAGRYQDGVFMRVDGTTGYLSKTVPIQPQPDPDPTKAAIHCNAAADCGDSSAWQYDCQNNVCVVKSHPYGAVVDQYGILWAPNLDNFHLFYFDTTNTAHQGVVTPTTQAGITPGGTGFYGVALDGYSITPAGGGTPMLIQQIWMANWGAGGAFRYRPKRTTNFTDLAMGTWAYVTFTGVMSNGRGIAVDNRTPANVWVGIDSAPGQVGKISDTVADGTSTVAATNVYNGGAFAGNTTLGVGVANDLDIWGVNQTSSTVTHYSVDANINLAGADLVKLTDNPRLSSDIQPNPYTYSDFTGFGLRNFTNPRGFYQWKQVGCGGGAMGKTKWLKIIWDADTPTGTSVSVKARASDDPATLTAATWTMPYTTTPADLSMPAPGLMPDPSGYLQVEFDLSTTVKDATPRLKSFQIVYECITGVG